MPDTEASRAQEYSRAPWRICYAGFMKRISQSELRDHSGEILRQAELGEQFTVTVKGRPVALLGPYQKRQWVPREELLKILRTQPPDPTLLEDVRNMGGAADELDARN